MVRLERGGSGSGSGISAPPLLLRIFLAAVWAHGISTAAPVGGVRAAFLPPVPPSPGRAAAASSVEAATPPVRSWMHTMTTTTSPRMATLSPADSGPESGNVGVVGRGFVACLAAKLSALRGYETWMLCPRGQEDTIRSIICDDSTDLPKNLHLMESADSEGVRAKMAGMGALIVAVDDQSCMNGDVIDYVLDPDIVKDRVKRVVGMSRNLNGSGMGFFVSAAKRTANPEVWDMGAKDEYGEFESRLRAAASRVGAEYTIARAGTLKGGGCGEDEHPQFLTQKFYDITKKDIVAWQLLFDCKCRGVELTKGDVRLGPGGVAILTANSYDACDGDTSRAGIAEAMVRSLEVEGAGDADFGVGTAESRDPPTDDEWDELFSALS